MSGRIVSAIVILLAMTGRIIQLVFFYNIRVDASYQVMAMQNFINGHGVSNAHVMPQDLSRVIYEPLVNWPPGYSLLLSPFYIISGQNYIVAGLALDICCALLLMYVSRAILKLFNTPVYLRNLFSLVTGFFIYSFYFIASSDAIAIAFFVTAIYLVLRLVEKKDPQTIKVLLFSGCLLLCGFIKYLFIPVVFITPCFLLLKGFINKEKNIQKAGIISFLILAIGLGALLIYQKNISGTAAYISQPERGFFPGHLMDTYPFLPASFLTPETVQLVIHSNTILYGFQIVHLLLVIVFLFYVAKDILRHKLRNISTAKTFFLLSFFISAAIAFLLAWLSVFVAKEEILPGYFWTYVEEARYYGLIYILAQLSLFIFYRKLLARPFLKLVFYVLILFLSVEMLRGVFFDARRIALLQKEEYSWQYEDRFQKYADKIIREGQQKYNVKKTVVTGSMYFMNHRVSLYSHVPLLYASLSINDITSLKASEPILVLVILHRKSFQDYQPFLAHKKNEVAGKFDGFYFYTVYVRPH